MTSTTKIDKNQTFAIFFQYLKNNTTGIHKRVKTLEKYSNNSDLSNQNHDSQVFRMFFYKQLVMLRMNYILGVQTRNKQISN